MKDLYCDKNVTEPSNDSDDGLAPNRWHPIIWDKADPIHWRLFAALGEGELMDDEK